MTVVEYVRKMKEGYGRRMTAKSGQAAAVATIPILDINSFDYTDLKQSIVEAEKFVLRQLGF